MLDFADAFKLMPDGAEKSALAMEVFGQKNAKLIGYLNKGRAGIAAMAKEVARLERNIDLQNRCGVHTRMLSPLAAQEIVPELDLTGIVGASYNPSDGILFPWPFLWGYARQAAAHGVRIFTQTPVTALVPQQGGGYEVVTARGTVRARRVINATGSWSPQLAKMIGVDVPTYPIRHEICSSEPLKPFLRPMVSELSSGLYCSQSMRGEIVGGVTVPGHGSTYAMGSTLEFLATYSRRLVKLMPIHFGAWAGMGHAHLALTEAAEALSAYEHALAINPHLECVAELVQELRAHH